MTTRTITRTQRHADAIATFRWIEVRLMETLASWVPSTPELEVKLLFGEHLWSHARHADALGHRTRELRAPLHDSREPVGPYVEALATLAAQPATEERLAGWYRALLPDLAARYERYLERTDPILDGPSVRIVRDVLAELARMQADLGRLARELPALSPAPSAWSMRLAESLAAAGELVTSEAPVQTEEETP